MVSLEVFSASARAAFTAAMIISCSISTSSGSTASGSMVRAVTCLLPLTDAVTAPPPAEADYVLLSSSSWVFIISSCIFWACFIRSL